MPPPAAPYPVIAVKRVCSTPTWLAKVSQHPAQEREVSLIFRIMIRPGRQNASCAAKPSLPASGRAAM